MKSKITLFAASAGLLFVASSFSFGPIDDVTFNCDELQQKEKHIKIIVNSDGKTTKIDTTFMFTDESTSKEKIDSILESVNIDRGRKDLNRIIILKGTDKMVWHDKGNHMSFSADSMAFSEFKNDSALKKFEERIAHQGNGKSQMIIIQDGDKQMMIKPFPPIPPMPPNVSTMIFEKHDRFAFDPNDENIITYDIKDIGKDREKITIIRKKSKEPKGKSHKEVNVEIEEITE